MSRLPTPGSDDGTWGGILNDFLNQAHNSDGSLKSAAVTGAGAYSKPAGGIPASDLSAAAQAALNNATASYVGPTQPSPPTGTEYIWFQTDGNGNLLDILSGKA